MRTSSSQQPVRRPAWRRLGDSSPTKQAGAGAAAAPCHSQPMLPPPAAIKREAGPAEQPQQQLPQAPRQCFQCGGTQPGSSFVSSWCREPITRREWLCHPCYNKAYRQLKKQKRQPQRGWRDGEEEDEEEEVWGNIAADELQDSADRQAQQPQEAQRQCFQCGGTSPGAFQNARWRREPITRREWLCEPCRCKANYQLKKQQRQQQQKEEEEVEEEDGETVPRRSAPVPQRIEQWKLAILRTLLVGATGVALC